MDAIGAPGPPRPPQLVGEVLGTGQLPDNLVEDLLDWFQFAGEEGGSLSTELSSGRWLHAFLGNLYSRVDPSSVLERLSLLGVDRDRTVDVLHLFFSVPVGKYSTEKILLAFSGGIPTEGLLPLTDIHVVSFAVRCAVCSVPIEDHIIHVEGTPPQAGR